MCFVCFLGIGGGVGVGVFGVVGGVDDFYVVCLC